jgi:hypothetical protein
MFFTALRGGNRDMLDALYATLPLTRNDIVKSRYLLSVIITLVVMVIVYFTISFVIEEQSLYPVRAAIFPMCILYIAVLSPGAFKWGNSFIFPVMLLLALAANIVFDLVNIEEIYARIGISPVMSLILLYTGSLLLLYLSYRLSCRFYQKRDL